MYAIECFLGGKPVGESTSGARNVPRDKQYCSHDQTCDPQPDLTDHLSNNGRNGHHN